MTSEKETWNILVKSPPAANVKLSATGRVRSTAFQVMVFSLIVTGVLGGIAALVVGETVEVGRRCKDKLHDRYHE
jgi:hypothetical protein